MRDMFEQVTILEKALQDAVAVMENAAKQTNDPETFKILTIGFDKIKEKLNESGRV